MPRLRRAKSDASQVTANLFEISHGPNVPFDRRVLMRSCRRPRLLPRVDSPSEATVSGTLRNCGERCREVVLNQGGMIWV